MDRKVLREITVAGILGTAIGIVFGVALVLEFGLSLWPTLAIAGILGSLAAAVSFRPREVYYVVSAIINGWRKNLAAAGAKAAITRPFFAVKNTAVKTAVGIKTHRRGVGIFFFVIFTFATFIVVGRFWMGWVAAYSQTRIAWLDGPAVSLGFLAMLGIAAAAFSALGERQKSKPSSWWMPISAWLAGVFSAWDDAATGASGQKLTAKRFFLIYLVAALAPLWAPPCFSLLLLVIVIDVAITLALALASTERLSAMAGALIGTLLGLSCWFFCGLNYLAIITAVFCAIGGLSGRWLYVLRCALAHKAPAPQAA